MRNHTVRNDMAAHRHEQYEYEPRDEFLPEIEIHIARMETGALFCAQSARIRESL